jgi:hypothetical protein
MSFSEEAKTQARTNPDLTLVDTVGPYPVTYYENNVGTTRDRTWEIYEVAGTATVTPLDYSPAVITDLESGEKAWEKVGVDFWQDASRWGVPLAADGPASWPRMSLADKAAPRRPVRAAEVSNIRMTDDRISFDVDRVGSPVLVKTSFFPNWKPSGAEGPWRVTPNQMVVIPTSRHVELHYGYTGVDLGALGLTFLGLAGMLALIVLDRNRRAIEVAVTQAWPRRPLAEPAPPPFAVPERELVSAAVAPEGHAQADQAAYGAAPPQHDRRPRRPLLDHADRDFDDLQARPFGSEDELGVEEVGAEPAALEDR